MLLLAHCYVVPEVGDIYHVISLVLLLILAFLVEVTLCLSFIFTIVTASLFLRFELPLERKPVRHPQAELLAASEGCPVPVPLLGHKPQQRIW